MNYKIIAGVILAVITLSVFIYERYEESHDSETIQLSQAMEAEEMEVSTEGPIKTQAPNEDRQIVIDVGGAVMHPGIVTLPADSRVYQAIEKAGGMKEEAWTAQINLAQIMEDGEKIYVPVKDEEASLNAGINQKGLININTADAETLQKINGVGPSTAEKIITQRTTYGKFKKIEELKNISGIGEKTFEKLKAQICVN